MQTFLAHMDGRQSRMFQVFETFQLLINIRFVIFITIILLIQCKNKAKKKKDHMIIECPNNKAEKLVFGKVVSKYDSEGTSTYEASRINFEHFQLTLKSD